MRSKHVSPNNPAPVLRHPDWSKNAVIYQINTRQFTPEGSFRSAEKQLSRLKNLGMDILYLMPVHEIGRKNRKGTLGSPYSVRDYYSVNREFGTVADLTHFVGAAHDLDMHVIIDWVANHTAWDNPLASEHPDWYARNWKGEFRPTPWRDWPDVIDLDYHSDGLRRYMINAMKYWVAEAGVDGFRCDVAGLVPTDFWNAAREELDRVKPVFMLAEWESRDLHERAFDMTYSWDWFDAVLELVRGENDLDGLFYYYSRNETSFPASGMRMLFVSNHDKNAWEGTEFELFGHGVRTAIVLSAVSEGMPLVYNGQEAGNRKRLAFFEQDPIRGRDHPHGGLYSSLAGLKKNNTALWNAPWGSRMIQVTNSVPGRVFSFVRMNDRDRVFAVMNFSGKPAHVRFIDGPYHGSYTEHFTREGVKFPRRGSLHLEPWGYRVFVAV